MLVPMKEKLVGTYSSTTPPNLMAPGDIQDGLNVRKVGGFGGWMPRRGSTLLNTTQEEGGAPILSLFQYTNPSQGDYHFIVQIAGLLKDGSASAFAIITDGGEEILTYSGDNLVGISSAEPLTQQTSLGDTIASVGDNRGIGCLFGDDFVYADGSGTPLIYGGDTPYCSAFVVYDSSEDNYTDYTREVTDGRTDTFGTLGDGASDTYFVCSSERAHGIVLSIDSQNTLAATLSVEAWRGSWTSVSSLDDGTSGTTTHDMSGTISWDESSSDVMRVLQGKMGYWYKLSFSSAVDPVTIYKCSVLRNISAITNKWDGEFVYVENALFYDQSADEYKDGFGALTNISESQYLDIGSATTSDYLYFKTLEPATGFGLGMIKDNVNSNAATIDEIEVWTGSAWTSVVSGLEDGTLNSGGTSSFSQTGKIWFNLGGTTPVKRTWQGDFTPGFWYRISWSAALSASVQIYTAVYAAFPESLPTYRGAVEFTSRLVLWGGSEFPNRLRFSAKGFGDVFSGEDSFYSDPIGDGSEIKLALKFFDYLVVWKERGTFLINSSYEVRQVSDVVGIAGIKTAVVSQVGTVLTKKLERVNMLMWQALDGVYAFDGSNVVKVIEPIRGYFDNTDDDYLGADVLGDLAAYADSARNEYHLLLPSTELVFNYRTSEWYPPWRRTIPLSSGLEVISPDQEQILIGGTTLGFLIKMEDGKTDANTSGGTNAIEHFVHTRLLGCPDKAEISYKFNLRKVWLIGKGRDYSCPVRSLVYKNGSDSGTEEATPEQINLQTSSGRLASGRLDVSYTDCFSISFSFHSVDEETELELYEVLYEVEIMGEIRS